MPAADGIAATVRIEPEKFSWHDAPWNTLTRDLTRLPHALLLHGQPGLGKNEFALRLAQFLLCQKPLSEKQACGVCKSCELFRSGSHPDLLRIEPLEDSKNILVDQVRAVIEFVSLKPHTAVHRVVLITPAEAMNVNAANSLLKVLEEPPAGCVLILVAAHLSRVSVTIRSRCRRVAFSAPPLPEALEWLTAKTRPDAAEVLLGLAGGAPLAALTFAGDGYAERHTQLLEDLAALVGGGTDPVTHAERWKMLGPEDCLEWLHRFLTNSIRQNISVPSQQRLTCQLLKNGKSFSISIIDLFNFIDKVSIVKRQIGTGVDETLALEELLIRWCEMTSIAA